MNEDINKIFEQWKQFLSWCYENNDKTTEIHRDDLKRVMAYTRQLENIIKEVRENINKKLNINSDYVDYDFGTELLTQELLEILDKENK